MESTVKPNLTPEKIQQEIEYIRDRIYYNLKSVEFYVEMGNDSMVVATENTIAKLKHQLRVLKALGT